jgi:predicted porin
LNTFNRCALAALAAVSVASAQSNVTIGGNMTLGFGQTTTGNVGAGPAILKQTGNIAFKGTEDLGGGLKANFEVQTAIGDAAASSVNAVAATATPGGTLAATTLGDRGAYITVTGGFGAVQMGRANSAVRSMMGIADVSGTPVKTGISTGNSLGTTIAKSSDTASRPIYGDAYSNWAGYTTPSISGFTFSVAIAPVDGDTTLTKDAMSYTFQYANGPLTAAYNLTDSRQTHAGQAIVSNGSATTDKIYIAAVGAYKMTTILASYDLGVAKVSYAFDGATVSGTSSAAAGTANTVGTNLTAAEAQANANVHTKAAHGVSVHVPFGAASVGIEWYKRDVSKLMNYGVKYDFSKRTAVGLSFGTKSGLTSVAGHKGQQYRLGMTHTF